MADAYHQGDENSGNAPGMLQDSSGIALHARVIVLSGCYAGPVCQHSWSSPRTLRTHSAYTPNALATVLTHKLPLAHIIPHGHGYSSYAANNLRGSVGRSSITCNLAFNKSAVAHLLHGLRKLREKEAGINKCGKYSLPERGYPFLVSPIFLF